MTRLLLIALFLAAPPSANAQEFCCLCEGCAFPLSERLDLPVSTDGTTCTQLTIQLADPDNTSVPGSRDCQNWQNRARNRCCNPNHTPDAIAVTPRPPSGGDKYGNGPHASCDICKDGEFPERPGTVVAILDGDEQIPNVNSCRDLYWYAKKGNLEERMCRPTRNYFDSRCCPGGGGSSGGGGGGGGTSDEDSDGECTVGFLCTILSKL